MREMRLAGYDLPGKPYRRVNRNFNYRNKRAGVCTQKVLTSPKVVTGKRIPDAQTIIIENEIVFQEPKKGSPKTAALCYQAPPKRHVKRKKIAGVDTIIATRRPKRVRKKPESDDGWGDLIEAQPKKKQKYRVADVTETVTTVEELPPKKAGLGDRVLSNLESGWKGYQARKWRDKERRESPEYKLEQEELSRMKKENRAEARAHFKKNVRDIKETVKHEKSKWVNKDVTGEGYDRLGYPKKGYKPPEKKPNPQQEPRGEDREEAEE